MKSLFLIPALLLVSPALYAQETPAVQEVIADANADFRSEFTNLSDEDKKEYGEILKEIHKLFSQKRIFEALDKITEAEAIIKGHSALLNFRAACYVEFRAFNKAKAIFAEALKLDPESDSLRFNAAELEFVTGNWNKALSDFKDLEKKFLEKDNKGPYRYLVQFKILLCYVSLKNEAEVKKYSELHDYDTDSPYYYYANAVNEFRKGEEATAQIWVQRAGRIFTNPTFIAPWQDTLVEFGYIKSFYGSNVNQIPSPQAGGQ